jgi:uncharacterized repeat protein (TIGR03803 family)
MGDLKRGSSNNSCLLKAVRRNTIRVSTNLHNPKEGNLMSHNHSLPVLSIYRALLFVVLATFCGVQPPASAQTFNVIHSFTGNDGATPVAGLSMDVAGNLYGTTVHGGNNGQGVVFKLAHKGTAWILSPLFKFKAASGGL